MQSLEVQWPADDPAQWAALLAVTLAGLVLLWLAFKVGAFVVKVLMALVALGLLGVAGWWLFHNLAAGR